MTHRKIASISQKEVPYGPILIEDLWPKYDDYNDLIVNLKQLEEKESEESKSEILPSERLANRLAQRAKEAEIEMEREKQLIEENQNNTDWMVE